MSGKAIRSIFYIACNTVFLSATLFSNTASAKTWTETSDAGELLGSAQTTIGTGDIDKITGTISTSYDVDLYKIKISDPTKFSALVSGGEGSYNWDSVLTLFNENGLGLYRNDDAESDSGNSGLPVNTVKPYNIKYTYKSIV